METKASAPDVDIIIVTMDNFSQLNNCVRSMLAYYYEYPVNIIVVNNGNDPLTELKASGVTVIDTGKNLGWEGALEVGLAHSKAKYVVFSNDDIFIPRASSRWIKYMVREMELYINLGAIGPQSNVVMGMQNMLSQATYSRIAPTSYLIGFCMMLRREALDKCGGIMKDCTGGDDLDLSIRLKQNKYKMAILNDIFVFHYGFQTGEKVHGTPDKPMGWNSREMIDETNMGLIHRHGFMEYWDMIRNKEFNDWMTACNKDPEANGLVDSEAQAIQKYLNGDKTVLELGCGGRKTVPHAIGMDLTAKGGVSQSIKMPAVTDIQCDVSNPLPVDEGSADAIVARHILEHLVDPVEAFENWKTAVKPGGKIIISCPDERVEDGIPLNPEHKHAFTPDSLSRLAGLVGLKEIGRDTSYNGMSFTLCLEKP